MNSNQQQHTQDMSKYSLEISFEGSAVDGEIDAEDLVHSLMGINRALFEANKILNKGYHPLNIKVKSGFRQGSFQLDLEILQSFTQWATTFLSDEKTYSAQDIAKFIGLSLEKAVTLIKVLSWLKGKIFTCKKSNSGSFILSSDDRTLEVSYEVFELMNSKDVRKSIEAMVSPLKKKGIDSIKYTDKKTGKSTSITKNDIAGLELKFCEEDIETAKNTSEKNIIVVTPSFEESYVWRVFDGEKNICAKVSDVDFLKIVNGGKVAFVAGDSYRVQITETQYTNSSGKISNKYEIIKFMKKVHFPVQTEMKF